MNSYAKTNSVNVSLKNETKTSDSSLSFWKEMEDNRFGITPMLLVIMACVGGIAAATVMQDSWVKLAFLAFSATFSLATILAVMPMRTVIISAAVAIAIDILLMII